MIAIYVLWLRQLKKFIRSPARIIGSLGQPLLFLIVLGFGFGPIYAKAGEGSYLEFLTPGVMAMAVVFTAMFSGIELIWDRQFGLLRETLVAPVPRWQIMLGRTLGGATISTFQAIIVFLCALLIGFRPSNLLLIPLALLFLILTALLFTAVGTAIATRLRDMQAFPIIMNFVVLPLFFLSGALFPIKGLHPAMATLVTLDPLSYGVDGLRAALSGTSHWGIVFDLGALGVITVMILTVGTFLFSRMEV